MNKRTILEVYVCIQHPNEPTQYVTRYATSAQVARAMIFEALTLAKWEADEYEVTQQATSAGSINKSIADNISYSFDVLGHGRARVLVSIARTPANAERVKYAKQCAADVAAGVAPDLRLLHREEAEQQQPAPCVCQRDQPVQHFYNHDTQALIVVRGALADFHRFYDVETFTGTNSQDEAQLADAGNWKEFSEYQYLEIPAEGAPQILELVEGTADQVRYLTEQHPGPFRIPGHVPFTATDAPDQYTTLSDLAEEMKQQGPSYAGRVVKRGNVLRWYSFWEEMGGSDECPWEPVNLGLGALPHDSYPYHSGRRATPEEGQGFGTVALWQEQHGAQRYYVETAPTYASGPAFPYLTLHTPKDVKTWYQFRFTPYAPPTI